MVDREGGLDRDDAEFEQFRSWMKGEGEDPYLRPEEEEVSETEEEEKKEPPPSVERRRQRQFSVTFTHSGFIERLQDLALEWNLYAPDGKKPATSTVIEYLLSTVLPDAEAGEIEPPPRGWRRERREEA
jgi:hypothetical protein